MTPPDNRFAKALKDAEDKINELTKERDHYRNIALVDPSGNPGMPWKLFADKYKRERDELAARADAVDVEQLKGRILSEMACQSEIVLCFDTLDFVIDYLTSRHLLSARPAGITREWQPIETAPKDEIKIWGYWTNKNGPFQGTIWWDWEMENWRDEYYPFSASTITHWMPLPAPPALDAVISMMEGE